ncbi:MAG: hypothetical protein BWZ10_01249 [candidate division BRC1 bacterium ADurb.BinA364]|nr:MAG: hypothetical protein BWZ10_01249 [candidate division BRC1 bacterium ADurb.BinA364]
MRDQLSGDLPDAPEAHHENQRAAHLRRARPFDHFRVAVGRALGGEDMDRGGHAADRRRDAGIGRRGEGGGHARHDFAGRSGGAQFGRFFGAAAKYAGIAAFEPDHPLARAGQFDEQRVGVLLLHPMEPGALARVDEPGAGAGVAQQRRIDQRVENDHVGGFQQPPPAQGQQARRAGAGADQIHRSGACGVLASRGIAGVVRAFAHGAHPQGIFNSRSFEGQPIPARVRYPKRCRAGCKTQKSIIARSIRANIKMPAARAMLFRNAGLRKAAIKWPNPPPAGEAPCERFSRSRPGNGCGRFARRRRPCRRARRKYRGPSIRASRESCPRR